MIVSLWGYYGFNYGDDIMMDLFIEKLTENNIKVILIDSRNGNLKEKVKNKTNVEVIDFSNLSKMEKMKTLFWLAKTTKLNFWGGGTVFTDEDGDGNFRFFLLLKLLGGKIGYVSVGIGDMQKISRKLKTKILIRLASIITLRDKKSYLKSKVINSKNSFNFEDVTYYYFSNYESYNNYDKKYNNKNYLLVSFRTLENYFGSESELKFVNQVVEVLPTILKKYQLNKVVLLPLDVNDVDVNKKIQNSLGNSVESDLIIDAKVNEMTEIIKNSSIYISGRLHGSVASEYFGIPTISLSYSNKINYFYESIKFPYYIDLKKEDVSSEKIDNIIKMKNKMGNSNLSKESVDRAYNNILQLLETLK